MAAYRKEIADIQATIKEHNIDEVIDFEFWVWVDRQGFRKWKVTVDSVTEVA
ncbi:hypothetical protein GJ688_18455 [Heliobacillus mobilis]|uniref:Uncharacterized protein n=1 Tax=Heliobacterium mobile TaxID=28064 RepID=A0A6I3SPD7_HELMO|nr:hypothetical protein [Heliobacterium mobile]MTV50904.1 hypothetical protein [Heliobacterium mobile]